MEARIIKRYANRKLYDTDQSSYVTLDEIAEMVSAGADVQIIDNRTGEDLSSVTLAQIVFEQEKKQSGAIPLVALRQMIQSGGEIFQRKVAQPVHGMLNKADESSEAIAGTLSAFVDRSHEAIEDMQKRIDERIHSALETMTQLPLLQSEVSTLRARIRELEHRIEELEQKEDG